MKYLENVCDGVRKFLAEKGKKLLKSLGLALLTGLTTWMSTEMLEFDFGANHAMIGMAVTWVVNTINEWVKEQRK